MTEHEAPPNEKIKALLAKYADETVFNGLIQESYTRFTTWRETQGNAFIATRPEATKVNNEYKILRDYFPVLLSYVGFLNEEKKAPLLLKINKVHEELEAWARDEYTSGDYSFTPACKDKFEEFSKAIFSLYKELYEGFSS